MVRHLHVGFMLNRILTGRPLICLRIVAPFLPGDREPMKRLILASVFALLGATAVPTVSNAEQPIQLAQARYDMFIDDLGRRVLVDPDTGEVVRVIENKRRSKKSRRQRRAERQAGRERRRSRLRRELDNLFGSDDEFVRDDDDFFDEDWDNNRPIKRRRLPPADSDTEVARLPDLQPPDVTNIEPVNPDPILAKPKVSRETIAKLQVFLDREGFSPGVIDGSWGSNVSKAIRAWQEAKGEKVDLTNPLILDKYVNKPKFGGFSTYTITQTDVAGPFIASIPVDYAEKARLEQMAYTSSVEMLAERFHMSEIYLRSLNPNVDFSLAGEKIRVVAPGTKARRKVHYIVADKSREQVRAYGRNGKLLNAYPATIGSTATPSPSGKVEVARIALNPNYTYNPKKNFQQGENNKVLTIPPGPNGPVGSVWIALSKPTYGIHGTPNPETIGKTNSHGCIRLTNWDAQELAGLVSKGVTVEFVE